MEYNINLDNEEKYIEINKNKKVYKIDISLTLNKCWLYFKNFETYSNYEKAFFELIKSSYIDINLLNECDKKEIINEIIKCNNLQKLFNENKTSNIYEQLYKTIEKHQSESIIQLKGTVDEILNSINTMIQVFSKEFFDNISQSINQGIRNTLQSLQNIINTFPTEKILQEIQRNYEKWGKWGWTVIPNVEDDFFMEIPKNQKEADKKCMLIINEKCLKNINTYIYKNVKHRKKFQEARKCYNQECYLASAMILTSLIERKLTEYPLKNRKDDKGRGKNAIISNYKEGLNIVDKSITDICCLSNIFAYLDMFFADGKDFKMQRHNVNRNFIMHGWRDYPTTKVDCIKLFLALYNIIFLWNNSVL